MKNVNWNVLKEAAAKQGIAPEEFTRALKLIHKNMDKLAAENEGLDWDDLDEEAHDAYNELIAENADEVADILDAKEAAAKAEATRQKRSAKMKETMAKVMAKKKAEAKAETAKPEAVKPEAVKPEAKEEPKWGFLGW